MQYVESVPLQFLQLVLLGQGQWHPASKVSNKQHPACAGASCLLSCLSKVLLFVCVPVATQQLCENFRLRLPTGMRDCLSQEEWQLRLSYLVYEGLGLVRIGQMFELIVDYPDSLPAIRDTEACLRHTSLRQMLVQRLR